MKLETFSEKFDQSAEAPDAMAKVREMVLELAFSGGLTSKRPTDGRVSDGLKTQFAAARATAANLLSALAAELTAAA